MGADVIAGHPRRPGPAGNPRQDGIELLEMANLPPEDTGVSGIIYISSVQGTHGPRVKWYPQAPKTRNDPCLSVSVSGQPEARNLGLPPRVADQAADRVKEWVALNHAPLLDFWNHGYSWTRQRVNVFIDGLQRLP